MFDLSDALEVFGSLVGGTRRREDRFAVAFQNAQPVTDIFGMVRTRLGGDTKIAAEERRTKLGDIS